MASWDDVIQDILYEHEELTPEVLKASLERHPEHSWDLIDFFTWWWIDELRPKPDPEEPLSAEEQAMIERGLTPNS